jgi:hypothetical protein
MALVMELPPSPSISRAIGRGWALKISTFLGPNGALASPVAISGPTPSKNGHRNGFARIKIITSRAIAYKQQMHNQIICNPILGGLAGL